jgi:hypothetical protein
LIGKPYTYFLTELSGQEERLFEMKEERLDPIRSFHEWGKPHDL